MTLTHIRSVPIGPNDAATAAPPHPTFSDAVSVFLRIGLLSFGGPAGQIALMHRMLVEERRWISENRFLAALNYCMLLPGPEAQQLAIYIGWLLHGVRGGIVAGVLFVLPGFCIILALSVGYALFQDTHWLSSLFFGLKAAVLAIVIEAVIRVGRRALRTRAMLAIAIGAFVAIFAFGVPFPLIVLSAGLIGYVGALRRPDLFGAGGHGRAGGSALAARTASVIDDDTPQSSGDGGFARAVTLIAVGGALWAVPVVVVGVSLGWSSIHVAIATFFSKMAVVTFGGAYAVLAYVAQQAVESFGWLKPGEMLDGLALAETTPGPLILVLTYVGFLAAFRDPGALTALQSGLLGAAVTTWVTFVPCFLWIFLGAPYIERLRGNVALSGALSAITSAVVGVIANLALWLALHTLFTRTQTWEAAPLRLELPVMSSLDPAALGLSLVAMVALLRLRIGIVPTLALCASLGGLVRSIVDIG